MLFWPIFDMLGLKILVAYFWPNSIFWPILACFDLFLAYNSRNFTIYIYI